MVEIENGEESTDGIPERRWRIHGRTTMKGTRGSKRRKKEKEKEEKKKRNGKENPALYVQQQLRVVGSLLASGRFTAKRENMTRMSHALVCLVLSCSDLLLFSIAKSQCSGLLRTPPAVFPPAI